MSSIDLLSNIITLTYLWGLAYYFRSYTSDKLTVKTFFSLYFIGFPVSHWIPQIILNRIGIKAWKTSFARGEKENERYQWWWSIHGPLERLLRRRPRR
jgi:hypothetical protein